MSCFDNYIALKGGCGEDTLNSSGFYVNQVGIDRDFIESIINADSEDVDTFFSEKRDLAVSHIERDLYKTLSHKFNTKSILEGERVGYYQDNMVSNPAITGFKGLQIQTYEPQSFLNVFVSKISLQVAFTGNVSVLVYDLKQNKLLDTLIVPCITGEISSLVVNKEYRTEDEYGNLAFIYNSAFASYRSYTYNSGCSGCFKSYPYRMNRYVMAGGVTATAPFIQSSMEGTTDTGGLSVLYSLQCDPKSWLCTNANLMATALLYKTGYLIIEHALYFSRQMNSDTFMMDKLKERLSVLEVEYNEAMERVMKNLRLPSGVCFFCNRPRMIKTVLPG